MVGSLTMTSLLTGCGTLSIYDMNDSFIRSNCRNNYESLRYGFILDGDNFEKFCVVPASIDKKEDKKGIVDINFEKVIGEISAGGDVCDQNGNILYYRNQVYYFNNLDDTIAYDYDIVSEIKNIDIFKEIIRNKDFDKLKSFDIIKSENITTRECKYFIGKKLSSTEYYDFLENKTFKNTDCINEKLIDVYDSLTYDEAVLLSEEMQNVDVEDKIKNWEDKPLTDKRNFKEYFLNKKDETQSIEEVEEVKNSDEVKVEDIYKIFDESIRIDEKYNDCLIIDCKEIALNEETTLPNKYFDLLNEKIKNDNITSLKVLDCAESEPLITDFSKINLENISLLQFEGCEPHIMYYLKDLECERVSYLENSDYDGIDISHETILASNAKHLIYTNVNGKLEEVIIFIDDNTTDVNLIFGSKKISSVTLANKDDNINTQDLKIMLSINELNDDTQIAVPNNTKSIYLMVKSINSVEALSSLLSVDNIILSSESQSLRIDSSSYSSKQEFIDAIKNILIDNDELVLKKTN